MTQHVMSKEEGAVLHIQLDSMIKALGTFDTMAGEAGDADVLKFMAKLYEAREAALTIACRRPLPTRVVSLAKR